MAHEDWLTDRFEEHRRHLFGVAYRMLGSTAEAEDAVQEAWLRLSRSDDAAPGDIDNLGGWLTTVVSRISLNVLRARATHREDSLDERLERLPEPVVTLEGDAGDPVDQALLADSVGIALLVVLDQLSPAERLAFVLHDLFALPFDEIAPILGKSRDATRQLASRARRRVQGRAPSPDADLTRQRAVVDAFFAAARDGDLQRLVAVLHPDVVLHADMGSGITGHRGAEKVAGNAIMYAHPDRIVHPAYVNGAAGAVTTLHGALFSIMAFTVVDGRIVEIEAYAAPDLTARLGAELGLV
ncbi:sigma-70 family RNA polymerase sigma factor [Nocardioides alcanivorans]|uniref:sigma-70 family RNA polymerase sigma factor n=1 Tax=Nocardioides alcanivorans TaxID=2897352 RepID=UPI001F30DEB9|nr:sigma-70 family RNA polymerase sigma factor [Nocardioides alcanivorans]